MLLAGTYTGMDSFTSSKAPEIEGGIGAFIIIVIRPVQSLKAATFMLATPSGKVIEDRLVHSRKAEPPMLVTPSGRVTEDRLLQL